MSDERKPTTAQVRDKEATALADAIVSVLFPRERREIDAMAIKPVVLCPEQYHQRMR